MGRDSWFPNWIDAGKALCQRDWRLGGLAALSVHRVVGGEETLPEERAWGLGMDAGAEP